MRVSYQGYKSGKVHVKQNVAFNSNDVLPPEPPESEIWITMNNDSLSIFNKFTLKHWKDKDKLVVFCF